MKKCVLAVQDSESPLTVLAHVQKQTSQKVCTLVDYQRVTRTFATSKKGGGNPILATMQRKIRCVSVIPPSLLMQPAPFGGDGRKPEKMQNENENKAVNATL